MFVLVQALVYLILSNSANTFSKTKMRSLSFKQARSISISWILVALSNIPAGEHSPSPSIRGSTSRSSSIQDCPVLDD
ncbi:hypothetical protein K2173_010828 [Erythroxylum novogranatense]|uniref:Secreted protein n=1 Tax=Erythroxylum novogranatense TaxID=1862640 RepID=A0AAV8SZS4_9ROSI|nr:hypothetical protein K2173_010828 [Erythroxylum novogranatense]